MEGRLLYALKITQTLLASTGILAKHHTSYVTGQLTMEAAYFWT